MGLDFGALIPALAQGASSYMQGQRIGEHDREQRDALLRQRAFEEWARKQQLAQSADALKQRGEIDQQKLANAILLRQLQEQGSTQRTGMVQDATTGRTTQTNDTRKTVGSGNNDATIRAAEIRAQGAANAAAIRAAMQGQNAQQPKVPAGARKFLQERLSLLKQLDDAEKTATTNPNAFGLKNWAAGMMGPIGRTLRDKADPNGVQARASVGVTTGQQMHDLAGATVPKGEMELYGPGVGSINDQASTIIEKIKAGRTKANNDLLSFSQTYGIPFEQLQAFANSSDAASPAMDDTDAWLKAHRAKRGVKP